MAEVKIQVGQAGENRFIGIKPPLTEAQNEWLDATWSREEPFPDPKHFRVVEPDSGEAYSLFGVNEMILASEQMGDDRITTAAREVARVLVIGGDTVEVDETVYTIGVGRSLFDTLA